MPRFTVRVDGLTEALATLGNLPDGFRDAAAETIDKGSALILSEMLSRVPVDEGDMLRSAGRNVRADGLQAAVGYGDYKSRFVEFGTEDTPAQPSLYPAFRVGARFVRREMREWAKTAGKRSSTRTRRGKRANRGTTAGAV